MPNNAEFLKALFGADAPWAHVTDFPYDPNDIPADKHLKAWAGNYAKLYPITPGTNQYFTISLFHPDEKGKARRRKALYKSTPVIVLDDVKEKLSMDSVSRLPEPSWILETSPGSEQWGYILDKPCTERAKVENLLDGLVANGLAPEGKDPGMKGVTRYVRLPDGYNTKASKMVNGQPFKCRLLKFEPFNRVSLDALAKPFGVDLNAPRRDQRVDGASDISDHPLLGVPDLIRIKEVRSAGRFDITCPWVEEHTGADDSGAGIFTNGDGTIGFKCHHGACQERTGKDLLEYLEEESPGFNAELTRWQALRSFTGLMDSPRPPAPDFTQARATDPQPRIAPPEKSTEEVLNDVIADLRREIPYSSAARERASKVLQFADQLPEIEKLHWQELVRDHMRWTKSELKNIISDLRKEWYASKSKASVNFYDDVIFVAEQNQFFDRKKRMFYTVEAYHNTYSHLDAEARKEALQGGMVTKVDKLDYAPKMPAIFEEGGIKYGNTWSEVNMPKGAPGDVTRWLEHWDVMGWTEHRDHMLKWIAYTIRHPENKINHMLLLGSAEGCGKDFLLYPLIKAMGEHHKTIDGETLLEGFHEHLLSTKYINLNETELGDRREATTITNKLRPLAAAPPEKLRVNQKNLKPVWIRNIVNITMTTNSQLPVRVVGHSRRIYAAWSDLNVRDEFGEMTEEWRVFWRDRWNWMIHCEGWKACVYYLYNCVDLSNFNAGEAPPVTEFLREIQESSKSPMQQTVEAFMQRKIGAFRSDLSSSQELLDTLRAGEIAYPALMYCESRWFTPNKVNDMLKQIPTTVRMDARSGNVRLKLWVLRNKGKYKYMTPSELFTEYERQMQNARKSTPLSVVK